MRGRLPSTSPTARFPAPAPGPPSPPHKPVDPAILSEPPPPVRACTRSPSLPLDAARHFPQGSSSSGARKGARAAGAGPRGRGRGRRGRSPRRRPLPAQLRPLPGQLRLPRQARSCRIGRPREPAPRSAEGARYRQRLAPPTREPHPQAGAAAGKGHDGHPMAVRCFFQKEASFSSR